MTRILIIEDNKTNLSLMTYVLDKFGYVTCTATDGEEGLVVALREKPALIMCDMHMPHVDGWEFADRIKREPALMAIPLIAVTAFAMVGDRERILAAGFDGYISKPIEPEVLVARVAEFLRIGGRREGVTEEKAGVAT